MWALERACKGEAAGCRCRVRPEGAVVCVLWKGMQCCCQRGVRFGACPCRVPLEGAAVTVLCALWSGHARVLLEGVSVRGVFALWSGHIEMPLQGAGLCALEWVRWCRCTLRVLLSKPLERACWCAAGCCLRVVCALECCRLLEGAAFREACALWSGHANLRCCCRVCCRVPLQGAAARPLEDAAVSGVRFRAGLLVLLQGVACRVSPAGCCLTGQYGAV